MPDCRTGVRSQESGVRIRQDLAPVVGRGVRDLLPALMPLDTEEKMERFRIASAWDGHANMLLPTHALVRGGDIVGGSSLGAVTLANTWFHTEKLKPIETLRLANLLENVLRVMGHRHVAINAPSDSPNFKNLRELFGYQFVGMHGLFVKRL